MSGEYTEHAKKTASMIDATVKQLQRQAIAARQAAQSSGDSKAESAIDEAMKAFGKRDKGSITQIIENLTGNVH